MNQSRIYYIYRIINRLNEKTYIGFTDNPDRRWRAHVCKSETANTPIYKAFRKYQIKNFKFEVIYCSLDRDYTLKIMEPYFIKQHNSYILEYGYNLTFGGEATYGRIPSEETRRKISEANKGRVVTEETRKKQRSNALKNPIMWRPGVAEKMSKIHKEKGTRPPPLSDEQKEIIRINRIGRPIHSKERKQQLSKQFTQNNPMHNPETREKARKNKIGKGTRDKNGRAVFCEIFSPLGEKISSGHLATICKVNNFPFNKFLANSRTNIPLQRGIWKGWNIIRIPRQTTTSPEQ